MHQKPINNPRDDAECTCWQCATGKHKAAMKKSRKRRIALIVGNGLSIDYVDQFPDGKKIWSPSWPLNFPGFDIGTFTRLAPAIKEYRAANPDADDFSTIQNVVFAESDANSQLGLYEDAKRLYAFAYRYFHHSWRKALDNVAWWWARWIYQYRHELSFCVSFNYDLILEKTLKNASIQYHRIGLSNESVGLPVFKPHGSIDFQVDVENIANTSSITFVQCNAPQRSLSDDEMHQAHINECNLVLPGTFSQNYHLQSVRPGYDAFASHAPSLTHVVMIGISYWYVDAPEIDFFLDQLTRDTTVILANVKHSPGLIKAIDSRGLKLEFWDGRPQMMRDGSPMENWADEQTARAMSTMQKKMDSSPEFGHLVDLQSEQYLADGQKRREHKPDTHANKQTRSARKGKKR